MGMLYPRTAADSSQTKIDNDDDDDVIANDPEEDDPSEDPLSSASAIAPSAMGLSICISDGALVQVAISAASYDPLHKPGEKEQRWQRRPLPEAKEIVGSAGSKRKQIFDGHAEFEVLARSLEDGSQLLTISVNNREESGGKRPDIGKAIFQVKITCTPVSGEILPYPSSNFVPPTAEERELRVVYGNMRPYAAGHGIAADWKVLNGKCTEAATATLPCAHVWRPRFDSLRISTPEGDLIFSDKDIFQIYRLAYGEFPAPALAHRLTGLVTFYRQWIHAQGSLYVDPVLEQDANTIVERCANSADRMQAGVEVLRTNAVAYRAFTLANRAMLMSMCHSARCTGRGRADGMQGPFELGNASTEPIDYRSNTEAAWRPFQLAFMLQILPSLVDKDHADRSIVDVIWFATGGGKTEAYLLASAFELIFRRLLHKQGGEGTGVINRYTYRFLTADQFQRTAGMVCALEMLRQEAIGLGDLSLGTAEFSIGLFAGGEVSPNSFAAGSSGKSAQAQCTSLYESHKPRAENPFPIESCPCCGTLLMPEEKRETADGFVDKSYYGFSATANSFLTQCPDEDCPFHARLPIYFIDEELYKHPPSFLLGTIDKFAMIPWKAEAGRLLGSGTKYLPPSLIIQDELHLISGPLGTLAGIYEAGFETVMSSMTDTRPKIIASTATIRNASTQCRRIYGRETSIFPSPGLRAKDSFFATLDEGELATSRLYVGAMAQGIRSTIAVAWTIAAVLQGVHELDIKGNLTENERDAYWTLMAYHNSKRELGRIANATRDEIPARLQVYAAHTEERSTPFRVLELKAHSDIPVPQARQLLAHKHTEATPAIDIAPCTSIISVGVDIDRLGIMLVNGQPKLTAEYIQATSRVGRGTVPGLVITCYSPTKPRDRSHYEAFRDYHDKFYSFVEPTSVTPGAIPALDRALHAALVTVVRHGAGLRDNFDAKKFKASAPHIAKLIEKLELRLRAAYPNAFEELERERISSTLAQRAAQWEQWIEESVGWSNGLLYTLAWKQNGARLLLPFGDAVAGGIGWNTLQSMRHVDTEIVLEA
jgi:hypothetical protein